MHIHVYIFNIEPCAVYIIKIPALQMFKYNCISIATILAPNCWQLFRVLTHFTHLHLVYTFIH